MLLNALKELNYPLNCYSISLFACTLETIKELNAKFMKKRLATNVLAWPQVLYHTEKTTNFPKIPPNYFGQSKEIFLGDIAISPQFCKDESFKLGINFKNHLKFIVVHAILHSCVAANECVGVQYVELLRVCESWMTYLGKLWRLYLPVVLEGHVLNTSIGFVDVFEITVWL